MSPFNYFQVVINPKFPDMIMMLMIDNKDNKAVSRIFYFTSFYRFYGKTKSQLHVNTFCENIYTL